MVKVSIIVIALCFAFSYADTYVGDIYVTLLVINPVDSGRTGPPYDNELNVTGLDKGVTLENAMEAAFDTGKFSFRVARDKYGRETLTTIDGVYANSTKKEYWHILGNPVGSHNGWKSIPLNMSTYQLNVTGQKILFRRDTIPDHSHDEGINVTLLVINSVNSGRTGGPYDHEVKVTGLDKGVTLEDAMDAAVADGKFSYSGIQEKIGLYVTTIDGVYANSTKKEYWHILGNPVGNSNGWKSLPSGVSDYQLNVTGQKILFRRDTWSEGSPDCGEHSYECKSGSVSVDHGYWFLISTLLATFTHWI